MKSPWRRPLPAMLFALVLLPTAAMAQTAQDQIVDSARTVLDEIMAVPASQIPQSLLGNAAGVAIFPNVVKGGFVVGVRHGRGVVLVRDESGAWHPPMFASLTGGSVGWQAGLQATDVVLVFRSRRSVNGLMNGKFTIGADAAAAAGPVGRQAAAATDATLGAEILSYSRSRGLFAGVSIDGSALQLDQVAGSAFYGRPVIAANGESAAPAGTLPASAVRLMNRLAHYTGAAQIVPVAPANGTMPAGVATVEVPKAESVRRELATSWQSLAKLLDSRWQAYLEPPQEVLASGQPANLEKLREKLQRYEAVSADQQFAALTRTAEFGSTIGLLRQYLHLQAPPAGATLKLPPPPTDSAARPQTRY